MLRILLIFISVLVFASPFDKDFADFDKNFIYLNKAKQLESYQKLKTIYIKTIISGDEEDRKKVLTRIIKGSKVLKLDAKAYENELNTLNKDNKKIEKPVDKSPTIKPVEKKLINKEVAKQESTAKKIESKNENKTLYIVKIHKINSKDKEGIELTLQGTLDENSIKYSKYNNNQIIEFDAALDTGKKRIENKDYEINVVQYNPKRARIVFTSAENYEFKYENTQNKFLAYFKKETKETKKPQSVIMPSKKPLNPVAAKEDIKKESPKKEEKNIKELKAEKKEYKTLYITQVSKINDGVKLQLVNELNENSLKTSSYGKSQIIEFDGFLNGTRRNYDFKTHTISVLQYNPKRVRIVLNSKNSKKLEYKIEDNVFYAYSGKFYTPKSTSKGINKSKFLITIDAGHGGKDGGANAFKRYEKNITLAIALKLEKALKQKGYNVFLTRKKDVYIGLRDRTKMANDKKSDLFISIHANSIADKKNASKVHGVETYFLSPARSERSKNAAAIENKSDIEEMNYFSKQTFLNFLNREKIISSNKLAIDIQGGILSAIPKKYKAKDGGVKEAPFWVLVGALMPAVLIEVGYISHPEESKNIADPIYQNHLVNGIVNGIESYFEKNKK